MSATKLVHFLVLFLILMGGIGVFYSLRGNPTSQFAVGIATSIAYVFWGIIHHMIEKDLHLKVVIEYVLIGTIAVLFLSAVLH